MFTAHNFFELLREQANLLGLLIKSGEQQRQAIEANRMSELIAILAEKQPHLDRLGQIRQQLHQHRSVIEQSNFWPDAVIRQRCQTLRDQGSQSFQTLIDLEQECEQTLLQSRDQIQFRLQSVESGRVAALAYRSQATAPVPPRPDFSSVG